MAVLRVCHGATNSINQESLAPVINVFIYAFIFGCAESLLLQAGFSLVAVSGCYSLVVVLGLLIAAASLVEHRLQ